MSVLALEKKPLLSSESDGSKAGSDKSKSPSGSFSGTGLGTALAPVAQTSHSTPTATSDLLYTKDNKESKELLQDVSTAKAKIAGLESKVQTLEVSNNSFIL